MLNLSFQLKQPFVAPKPMPRINSNESNGNGERPTVAVRRTVSLRSGSSSSATATEEKENKANNGTPATESDMMPPPAAPSCGIKRSDSERSSNGVK